MDGFGSEHGYSRADVAFAIVNASYQAVLPEPGAFGGIVTFYTGPQHAQTERELEVLIESFTDGREAIIFHALELGTKLRRYREEHPNG